MKYHPQSEIIVNAPIEAVWGLLSDFENYSKWTDLLSFKGVPKVGSKVPLVVSILGKSISTPVMFLRLNKNSEIAWVGGPTGLLTGEHYFQLSSIDKNTTKVIQGEKFKGLLTPVLMPLLKGTLNKLYTGTDSDIEKYFSK